MILIFIRVKIPLVVIAMPSVGFGLEFLVYDLLSFRNCVVFSGESAEWVKNLVVDSFHNLYFFKWVEASITLIWKFFSEVFNRKSISVLQINLVDKIRSDAEDVLLILVFCIFAF